MANRRRGLRGWLSLAIAPVTLAGTGLVPVTVVATGVAAASVAAVIAAKPAQAAGPTVLILSTSVNGGSSSAEAQAATAAGATVTVATPTTWDAMTTTQFKAYSAIVIGDPSSGSSCASSVPSDALSTAATWGPAITGNVAVLGTAPVLAGSAGGQLIADSISYALAGSTTGLYVSLNCEYSSAAAGTSVPLLAHVDGGGFVVTGQSSSCPSNSGTVNTWQSVADAQYHGIGAAGSIGPWPSPACAVQETFTGWPAGLGGLGYDKAATPAVFTASDGASAGQAYLLAGAVPSVGTAALAPATGGEVPAGAAAGGAGNPAAPGVAQLTAGDPVNTENGDFTQSATDLSIPTFGPALTFSRTYDALLAQQQTQTGTPGPMGYGWTNNWATALSTSRPVPGDIYTIDGLASDNGDGGPAASGVLNYPSDVWSDSTGLYIADTDGNRIQEIPSSSGTQWGIAMTAGDVYTIAGSPTGASGDSANGTAAASALLNGPAGVLVNSGNLYLTDSGNNRVLEIPGTTGSQRGISMTADDIYTIAGHANGSSGDSGDKGAATSAYLDSPEGIATGFGTSDLYIADTDNSRIQEIAAATGTQWGTSMTANDIYTVVGSSTGNTGASANGTKGTSALLFEPEGVREDSAGDLYLADTGNNRIIEMPKATGTQWSISMTANDIYTVAGNAAGNQGDSGDNGKATSALLYSPTDVEVDNGTQLYVTDSGNDRIQEVARTAHTEWGITMTANDIYTIAGSSTGTQGFSGDGGKATSALLDTPQAVTLDSSVNMYVLDAYNQRVREVAASTGDISTVAGDGFTLSTDGNGGPAVTGALFNPDEVATDSLGDIFVADALNNRVQEIAATSHTQFGIAMTAGDVYTVAGNAQGNSGDSGDGGPATSALLDVPIGVATDSAGDLYISDADNNRVQEVNASTGVITTVAGSASGNSGSSGDGGRATSALLDGPWGLAVDSFGDLYIADANNSRIQEVFASGGEQWGQHMTAGDIYTVAGSSAGTFGDSGNGGIATSALLGNAGGVAVDAAGNLYIADSVNEQVREVAARTGPHWGQQMTANDIYTVLGNTAGNSGTSGDGGPGTAALLNDPIGVTADAAGDIYIADSFNDRIQELAAADGTQWGQSMTAGYVYTVAGQANGTGGVTSGDGGPATSAVLNVPFGIAVDPSGDLFLTDESGNLVREVTSSTATYIKPASGQVSWLSPAPGGITVTQSNGSLVTFFAQTGGTCAAPYVVAGGYCTLPQDVGASLTFNSGNSTYTFSPAKGSAFTYTQNGVLTSESDAAGDTLTISYGSPSPGSGNCPGTASACDTITSAAGRTLTLGTNAAGLVTSATDPMGNAWTYAYTGSDLTKVTDPMGNITTYSYGAGSTGNPLNANNLLTMTSPNAQPGGPFAGDSTVNVYNAAGQVASQTDPAGFQTTFNYCVNAATGNCMNAATGTGYVTVTDPDGNATVYDYSQGALAAQSSWTAGTTLTSEQDFVPDTTAGGTSGGTLLDTASADGDGNLTISTYNQNGDLTSAASPDGVGSQTGTTTSEYTSLNLASCDGTVQASTPCSASETGPAPVAPGAVITPPSSAPPAGVTYTLYDTNGNLLYSTTGVYEPGGGSASYSQTSYTLYKGNSVTLGGNTTSCTATPPSTSLPCATINPDGVATQLSYDSAGDLTGSSTPDGNGSQLATTSYGYNGDGEQTSQVAPDGNVSGGNAGNYTTITAWNNDGLKSSVTQAGGSGATVTPRTTYYGYDADSNQSTVKDPRGYTTTTTYNADNEAALVTDPDGDATLHCYDGDGNLAQTVPPVGVAANSLTAASCPASYPSGYSDRLATDATVTTWDANGQQSQQTTPAPAGQSGSETTSYSYDGGGNLTQITAPPTSNSGPNQVTVGSYNSAGQLASVTVGSGTSAAATTTFCYDPNGDQTSVVMPDGNASGTATCQTASPWAVSASSYPTQAGYQTTSSYDSIGELVSATSPATAAAPSGATTSYTYDDAGNKLTATDPNGVTTTWTYTPGNLPSGISYSGSSAHSVANTYDADGNKTAMTDATGSSSFGYDPFGELTSAENGASQTTGYGYNADGEVTGITYPLPATASWASTDTVGYGYDNADLLTSVTDFNNHQISIGNTADGLPNSDALGSSGDTIATTYDATDSPSLISLKNASSTLASFSYSNAPAGNILAETDTPSSAQSPADYTYDAQDRVTSMTPGTGSTQNYGFDSSGNLTTLPTSATGTYNDASELTSSVVSGTTTSYSYNADGELLTASQGGTNIASGSWNGAGELTSFDNAAADMTAASYDGDGQRATETTSSGAQDFVWNLAQPIPLLIMDSANAYIYAGGGTPAEQVNLSSGGITYLLADSLGSVRGTVTSAGALSGSTNYNAFGSPETAGGLTSATPFGFAGGYTDADGLIYLLSRYYQPATGQFISIDPEISQTLQPYLYASDNPVNNTDPTGALHCRLKGVLSVYCYFTWKFTLALVAVGKTTWFPALVAIRAFIKKYVPPPLDDYLIEKIEGALVDGVDEAIKIVGGTSEAAQERYKNRANKSCLYLDGYIAWFQPYVRFGSYKTPKAWCLDT